MHSTGTRMVKWKVKEYNCYVHPCTATSFLRGWSFTSPFSTNMAIYEIQKVRGEQLTYPTQWNVGSAFSVCLHVRSMHQASRLANTFSHQEPQRNSAGSPPKTITGTQYLEGRDLTSIWIYIANSAEQTRSH